MSPLLGGRVHEAVSGAWLVQQVAGSGRVRLDLAAQLRDVHVQIARLSLVGGPPELSQDRAVGEQLPLVLRKQAQQLELARRQVRAFAGDPGRVLVEIDAELTNLDDGRGRRARTAQDRA